MTNRFFSPRSVCYGAGALENLATVSCRRALITTDRGIRALGIVERVENILQAAGAVTRVFDQVEAEPSKETAWQAFHLAQEFDPDLFVGLGGGSCMDVGKVAWLLFEHPDLADLPLSESLEQTKSRELRKKARYVAIPTTSGSGSEGTVGAVIVDREADPPLKPVFTSEHLVPDVSILDPELTVSLPPGVTADCGYDALVHAIEPYVWEFQSDLVDALSVGAARTILAWLPRAVADGKNLQAREKMHLASLQGAMAISNASLHAPQHKIGVHALAHSMGAAFQIPHGRANAFLLCQVFAFLYPVHKARLSSLAESLGIEGEDHRSRVANLLTALDELKAKVGIPLSIKDSGVEERPWLDQIDQLAARDAEGRDSISADEIREIYMHAWNGTRAELKV